jgi:hypothetical protein
LVERDRGEWEIVNRSGEVSNKKNRWSDRLTKKDQRNDERWNTEHIPSFQVVEIEKSTELAWYSI